MEQGREINGVKVYTAKEVSEILGVHIKTVQRYLRTNKLKAQKIGGIWYIAEENLNSFIKGE